ncbi:HNH endonuclease [Shewanella baltica]|uniref:HNH endonuclease n=1 Tax=Shewanella TaxID=22 RepID=UPI001CF256D2|nr:MULTISPECIES: HNH endonuclease [Shewanella]MCB2382771.1 HNH endonuclease [Shewanella sp. SR1]MCS6236657.1 HNH endonuclease [Shewanella baltica]MCS6260252.1 HNH endonuclease [Shewanella baltica]MCS6271039.1 HNH endonuclease [Shewanella baltica]MDR9767528.1 HNH endonuclease [Shewanella baltica]
MKSRGWNRAELLIAFHLYNQMPFGKISSRNPDIIAVAKKLERTPSALSMKMANIASCDPSITNSGRSGLKGASLADKAMWAEMVADWETFYINSSKAYASISSTAELTDILAINVSDSTDYTAEDRYAQTKTRIGQQQFRQSVLSAYDYHCCITGLNQETLLIASHIVPWRIQTSQRLNPTNGLCLSSIHDRAFDQGLITFNTHLELILSSKLNIKSCLFAKNSFEPYEGKTITLPTKFAPNPEFLNFHRETIFIN